jgi:hypothetical protein
VDETIEILQTIKGGPIVVDWLRMEGGWFRNFGDDELVALELNRKGSKRLQIESRRWVGGNEQLARITFVLEDFIDVNVEGFLHQNVIGGLFITACPPLNPHPSLLGIGGSLPDHQIRLEPCAGAFGTINATIKEIIFEEIHG